FLPLLFGAISHLL
uniref:Temporin-GH n=1 Tax=Sylvirana guentheri TaxID=110109 RepID=TPH_SYLGU|nr:RecName: Full=Temporin-GH; AltName: Full=AMP-5 [Sylvirana guentheri]